MKEALLLRAGELWNRTFVLPLLLFYPTSRCNSRCLSCDWWKSTGEDDLSLFEIAELCRSLRSLGTRSVVFSGGEPLLRPDVFEIAALFRRESVKLELLTSGVLLKRHARDVAAHFARVTISLDAASRDLYRVVRGIDGLEAVERGVARLREEAPRIPVTARATLHKKNFRELPRLVEKARAMGLDAISFLAADVTSTAFGRRQAPAGTELRLDRAEIRELRSILDAVATEDGFVAESREKLRRIPDYYAALAGEGPFPPASCNAPWVSAVIEADGTVRPCFFHQPVGNVRETPLATLVRRELRAFRGGLDVATDPVCERCVCSIRFGGRRT